MLFFLLPSIAFGKVEVTADGNLQVLRAAGLTHGANAAAETDPASFETDGTARAAAAGMQNIRVRKGDAPKPKRTPEWINPASADGLAVWEDLPASLRALLRAAEADAAKAGQDAVLQAGDGNAKAKPRAGREVRVGNVTLPLYVLTKAGPDGRQRRQRLMREYGRHLGLGGVDWESVWFHAVRPDLLVNVNNKTQEYTFKKKFADLFTPGLENYLLPGEVSHYVSFLAFLWNLVKSGQDRAFFLEDDINFIPIVEHSVFHNGEAVPWDKVPPKIRDAKQFEYAPDDFQNRFTKSIHALDAAKHGSTPEILYLGSIFSNGHTLPVAKSPEAQDRSVGVEPSCSVGTNALIISRAGAKKLLRQMVPIWLRTDSALYSAKGLKKVELIPNLVGQRKYWEIYKEVHGSTLSTFSEGWRPASFRVQLALGICFPRWDWAENVVNTQGIWFKGGLYSLLAVAVALECVSRITKIQR